MRRSRVIYLILIILTIVLGLASRLYGMYLPDFIAKYSGDVLWAIMVYLIFSFIFKNASIIKIILISLIFSYGIEISQLYQGNYINSIRSTTLGGLILGHGFLFSDIICYTIGILIASILEKIKEKSNIEIN